MKEILLNSIFVISLSIIIALFTGLFSFRKLSLPLKIMAAYTGVSTLAGAIISLMSFKGINNIVLVNAYSVIEFLLIITAFFKAFNFKQKFFLLLYMALIGLVTAIYCIQTYTEPYSYNNALKATISIIMVIASVGYLIVRFYRAELEGDKKPFILLALGTFMYFASSFLIVLAGSDNSNLTEIQVLWIYLIHSIFYFIFVIILTLAFLLCRSQSEHSSLY